MRIRTKKSILTALSALCLAPTAFAENEGQARSLNCDSTCVKPDTRTTPLPKGQLITAPTTTSTPAPRPKCGASAGSVLPGAPSSFLCSTGTPSSVSSTTEDGGTTYTWSCSNSLGTVACMADQRDVGMCGPDNGRLLTSNPTNACSSGGASGFSFNGNQYSWRCQSNYGSPAYCSATYDPPLPPSMSKTVVVGCAFSNDGYTEPNNTGTLNITIVPLNQKVGYLLPAGTYNMANRYRDGHLQDRIDGTGNTVWNVYYPEGSQILYYGQSQVFNLSDLNRIVRYNYCDHPDTGGS